MRAGELFASGRESKFRSHVRRGDIHWRPMCVGCPHKRMTSTALILRDDGMPAALSVSVSCRDCGQPFEFVGIGSTSTILVSEDHQEVRLLIRDPDASP